MVDPVVVCIDHCQAKYIYRGVFRTFELRVLTVIDCPKIAGAKGLTVIDFPILRVLKHP